MAIYEFASCPCGHPLKVAHRKGATLAAPWVECSRCHRRLDEPDANEWEFMTLLERAGMWSPFAGTWVMLAGIGFVLVAVTLTGLDWLLELPDLAFTIGIWAAGVWAAGALYISYVALKEAIDESCERTRDPEYRAAVEAWIGERRKASPGGWRRNIT